MHDVLTPWSVAIICSREKVQTVASSLAAVVKACGNRSATVDVLVNGNKTLADEARTLVFEPRFQNCTIRVWFIPLGDKAHAWNEYVNKIWPSDSAAFFVDGYVEVRRDAFEVLSKSLSEKITALGASGVPSSGRSAAAWREQMLRQGGLMGGMHVITADTMSKLRERNIRLPLGLYRTDSLIGALLMFSLDPAKNNWDANRIIVNSDATCDIPGLSRLTVQNIQSQIKRRIRQAQGDLENRAVRQYLAVERCAPEAFPATIREFVERWITAHSQEAWKMFLERPTRYYAAYKLRKKRNWHLAFEAPVLLAELSATPQL